MIIDQNVIAFVKRDWERYKKGRKEEKRKKGKYNLEKHITYNIWNITLLLNTNHASIRILYLTLVGTFSKDVKKMELDLKKSNKKMEGIRYIF